MNFPGDVMAMTERATPAQQLGQKIKEARLAVRVGTGSATQAWLGDRCEPRRTPQQISKYESGEALPAEIGILAELFHVLHRSSHDPAAMVREFRPWIVLWLAAGRRGKPSDGVQTLLDESIEALSGSGSEPRRNTTPKPLTSLAEFPGDDPLTIIMGDRREPRVTSAADCLIYSGSVTDAMFLPHMWRGLEGAAIRSDKLLVRMPQEYLEEQVPEISERNLLIIGSPAANWGARILNKGAIFPFRIDDDVAMQSEALLNDDRMQDEDFALDFWTLAQAADDNGVHLDPEELAELSEYDRQQREGAAELVRTVLAGSTAKAVMNRFRTFGVLDPADQENHGTSVQTWNDFAVVTMARNPYSKDGRHRAVVCAGIHGPGTAAALRELLINPSTFRGRNLGAVLEVRLRADLAWSERFDRAKVKPQTKEYAPQGVLDNVERALKAAPDVRKNVYQWWDRAALQDVAQFIREILRDARNHGGEPGR